MHTIKLPRVAVLVDTASTWGRNLIDGVIAYSRKHGPWDLWIEPHSQRDSLRLPPGWVGEGVIGWVCSHAMARSLAAAGAPVVNVSAIELKGVNLPRVAGDLEAKGRLAGEHLLDRGLRRFAYIGLLRLPHVKRHYDAFAARVRKAGASCIAYRPPRRFGAWPAYQEDLTHWLGSLPKPAGILTWGNDDGRLVINVCRASGILVPEQFAVLAGEDDALLCEACIPPLSAVSMPTRQIGHDAAALLDRLMRGRQPPKVPIFIEPTVVAARRSTDTLAIKDMDLAQAVRFIHEHANQAISVEDVLRAVPISRRQLEIRFQEALGRSPASEIRRVRFERAKHLLTETDMSIPEVASASGFGSPEYLAYSFKRDTGLSPQTYRSRIRGR